MTTIEEHRRALCEATDDDGSGNWLNTLVRHGWQVVPHCPALEFEIKYAPGEGAAEVGELGRYARLLRSAQLPPDMFVPEWLAWRESVAEYWLVDGVEWSLQRFKGRRRLKRKVHEVFHADGCGPLIQSQESFVEDPDRVAEVLDGLATSVGALHRTMAKGYLVRLDPVIVFNLSETRCRLGDAEQIQVELEYSCHMHRGPDDPAGAAGSEPGDVREALWAAERVLAPTLREAGLVPTTEKKLDFVRAAMRGRR